MGAWTQERRKALRDGWETVPRGELAKQLGTSRGRMMRIARQEGLFARPRRASMVKTNRILTNTIHPHSVVHSDASLRLLVGGNQSKKLGRKVTKGKWKGLRIYSLTLEERATCPATCQVWGACYGNNMSMARRHILDAALMVRLRTEVDALCTKYSQGILIRLHVLGDFGSNDCQAIPYIALWCEMMRQHGNLHIFGFTAHDPDGEAGSHLLAMNYEFADRCRIRFSGSRSDDGFGSVVIDRCQPSLSVVCPNEDGHVPNCGACGLCWTMAKCVEFRKH